jgi:plasmid stabilization system protein ParE
MKLRWTAGALSELEQIDAYIASDDPVAAQSWVEKLHARAAAAAHAPGRDRKVALYDREDIREVLLRQYRIVYLVERRAITVLAVREGHQRLPKLGKLLPT